MEVQKPVKFVVRIHAVEPDLLVRNVSPLIQCKHGERNYKTDTKVTICLAVTTIGDHGPVMGARGTATRSDCVVAIFKCDLMRARRSHGNHRGSSSSRHERSGYQTDFHNDKKHAEEFWISFRHGLVHEGWVKPFGQFSLELPNLLTVEGAVLIVNPRLLLDAAKLSFENYFEHLDAGHSALIISRLKRYFRAEIAARGKSGS